MAPYNGRMKFRLKTLFALTAKAGALFFLARFNSWLPVAVGVAFGPATVALMLRSRVILIGCSISLAMVAGAWAFKQAYDGMFGMDGKINLFVSEIGFGSMLEIGTASETRILFEGPRGMYAVWIVGSRLAIAWNWGCVAVIVGIYGVTLHLLSRWLEPQKARA